MFLELLIAAAADSSLKILSDSHAAGGANAAFFTALSEAAYWKITYTIQYILIRYHPDPQNIPRFLHLLFQVVLVLFRYF